MPDYALHLHGLESINWHQTYDAYGSADDVPDALQGLASTDAADRDEAHESLSCTIYHQGDIFDSTAAAIPFLVTLACEPRVPERSRILEFLAAIAESAVVSEDAIRRRWNDMHQRYPEVHPQTVTELKVDRQIADTALVRGALLREEARFNQLLSAAAPDLAAIAGAIQQTLKEYAA